MDQIKIGKFINKLRKENKLTQYELAEKLNLTDRAISKWETGVCMPDIGTIPELCRVFNISINDLFSGEIVDKKDYNEKSEANLLAMAKEREEQNKKMMMYEMVIGFMSSITFIVFIFVASFIEMSIIIKTMLFILSFLILIVGVSVALKIETETGYYECNECHHKYVPKYSSVYFAIHYGTTRYLKCPKCNKRSWNRKVLG